MGSLQVVLLSLLAAAGWGIADFIGGSASKKAPVYLVAMGNAVVVLIGSTLIGVLMGIIKGEPFLTGTEIFWATASGFIGFLGTLMLYSSLTYGHMGVVACISGLSTTISSGIGGVLVEGNFELLQWIGLGFSVIGVWLLTAKQENSTSAGWREILLAGGSGIFFAAMFLLVDRANTNSVFWPSAFQSVGNLLLVGLYMLIIVKKPIPFRQLDWKPMSLLGGLNLISLVLFLLAAQSGHIGIVGVICSLYPAFTVFVARIRLKESLSGMQWTGVVITFAAIALIAG